MSKKSRDARRIEIVKRLVHLDGGGPSLFIDMLREFGWDYNGAPYLLTRGDVSNILERYLDGEMNSEELEAWADAIELREDIQYEEENEEWIKDVIYILASTDLNGPITLEKVKGLLNQSR
ncbi:MAG: hypothetical protein E5X51_33630 [Mesorhizobium sp.]|uniref:hypothetical protein n=1 Tax=Mesorhizobium sp. TaxID=1871066 RepID=UPI00121C02C5|nr:hypothetical protein [Mesorhizobium sp.]TIQ16782.1 MAG: hypothetical protein E5X51_33630 [Mesorhizobium sp.]